MEEPASPISAWLLLGRRLRGRERSQRSFAKSSSRRRSYLSLRFTRAIAPRLGIPILERSRRNSEMPGRDRSGRASCGPSRGGRCRVDLILELYQVSLTVGDYSIANTFSKYEIRGRISHSFARNQFPDIGNLNFAPVGVLIDELVDFSGGAACSSLVKRYSRARPAWAVLAAARSACAARVSPSMA